MRLTRVRVLTSTALLCLLPLAVLAELPKRDLTIEVRQIAETDDGQTGTGGYTVSTAPRQPTFAPQQVRVRNGEKASLRITQSLPMQWVQKVESASTTLNVGAASASSSTGGVAQTVTWMEAGHTFTIAPSWPGGKRPATVVIDVQTSTVDERTSGELPASQRQQLATTITAPLRQWVTIATTGSAPQAGTYSSSSSMDTRRLVQIRVLAP